MNAIDDKNLSREENKGFFMFLYTEMLRHLDDVIMIKKLLLRIKDKEKLTPQEENDLQKRAKKYRTI